MGTKSVPVFNIMDQEGADQQYCTNLVPFLENLMIIDLSQSAIKQFGIILEKAGSPEAKVKIGVREGGCAGMSYTMDIVDKIIENAQVYDHGGIPVVIEEAHVPFLKGMQLDYNDDILNSGFKFANPNADETCGCGSSFSAKKAG